MQGKAALDDLYCRVESAPIVVADSRSDLTEYLRRYPGTRVSGRRLDLTRTSDLCDLMAGASVVVEALPPQFALEMASMAAEVGVSLVSSMYYVDPSATDPAVLVKTRDRLEHIGRAAEAKGIVILPEFGLDPGIDLVLGARALKEFDRVHTFNSYGTGLPVPEDAGNPLRYKFSWSVLGVLRACRRPAKLLAGGQVIDVPGNRILCPENIHHIEIEDFGGALECYPNGNASHYLDVFNLRGTVREMGRYACRYPGHCAFWNGLVSAGFVDEEPIHVGGVTMSPIEFTATLLSGQDQFLFGPEEADIAMVRVDVAGWSRGEPKRLAYQLIDRRDMETGFTAMQRTVGYTLGLGARWILQNALTRSGLLSPVEIPFELLEAGLAEFGMRITREELPWRDGEEGGGR
jgi:saccharopine dehydrogenase-like NADP-dependent oxidoreductase